MLLERELSESEDDGIAEEEAGDADDAEAGDSAPVEKAVIQLTKLVSHLSKQRAKPKGIEGIFEKLDGVSLEASSSTGGGGGRSKAVAYKKLKQAVTDRPEWLYLVRPEFHSLAVGGSSIEASCSTTPTPSALGGSSRGFWTISVLEMLNKLERGLRSPLLLWINPVLILVHGFWPRSCSLNP